MNSGILKSFKELSAFSDNLVNDAGQTADNINSIYQIKTNYFNKLLNAFLDDDISDDKTEVIAHKLLETNTEQEIIDWTYKNSRWFSALGMIIIDDIFEIVLNQKNLTDVFWKVVRNSNRKKKIISNILKSFMQYHESLFMRNEWLNNIAATIELILLSSTYNENLFIDFKNNMNWFNNQDGNKQFSDWAHKNQLTPEKLLARWHVSQSFLFYNFFNEYYMKYYENQIISIDYGAYGAKEIEDLWDGINSHPDANCKLMAAAGIAVYFNKKDINKLKNLGFYQFIDKMNPKDDYKWLPLGAINKQRKEQIEKSRKIIKEILNKITFKDFLTASNFDKERKLFWEKYIPEMDEVIFYIPRYSIPALKRAGIELNESVRSYKSDYGNVPTLEMHYRQWAIFEFGATANACYIYDKTKGNYARIDKARKLDEGSFKNTAMPSLSDSHSEGKLIHSGDWDYKLSRWLRLRTGLRGK